MEMNEVVNGVSGWIGLSHRRVVVKLVTFHSKTAIGAATLKISQKAGQHTWLLSERDWACLATPETTSLRVNADFIDRLAHSVPILGIADAE